jgi:hypothetical protein
LTYSADFRSRLSGFSRACLWLRWRPEGEVLVVLFHVQYFCFISASKMTEEMGDIF